MDAEALYPSIHIEDIMDGIMDIVTSAPIDFKNVNIDEMLKFVVIMYSEEEIIQHKLQNVVPLRQVNIDGTTRGKPTLAYLDSDTYTRVSNGKKELDVQKWIFKSRKPTRIQKRKIIALVLMATAKTILGNHIYSFNGKIYKQKSGGPIGEDSATKSAKVVMYKFINGYKQKLIKLSLQEHIVLLKIYVDDLNQARLCLPFGTRYIRGKIYIPGQGWKGRAKAGDALSPEEKRSIELEANARHALGGTQAQREKESAIVYRLIANDILPRSIRMKEDIPSNHPSGCLPILDTQMEIVNGRIIHHHYSKPMSSLEITNRRSAMSKSTKLSILIQEGARRARNTSKELP